ncbi:hypothetical protein F2Q70_00011986 [Brassica cretica]|uniref:Uncharacterized protein n=1 Tax=Brassica cretica TaxID=69181 RepID=A0A8S9M860_BRACR|nr:hypothetical protein F2Q70_00011986 [Brassica cretica]
MPKIDVARLNALKPKPKPSEQPPEPVRTPSDDGDDPMEEDRVSTGRTLRRRKEKVAKNLKRGANENEKENFQKRVFRIPLHKPFEEAYYSHRLEEISADTYAALTRHQFNLESLGERLQRIENTTAAMKDKWRRGDEAMIDFTATDINNLTSVYIHSGLEPKLTSNTKLDTTACLGAWHAWDRILQTSLEDKALCI